MVSTRIKYGTAAEIWIRGNSEQIIIELSHHGRRFSETVINKHPGLIESIFPSCIDNIKMAPLLADENQKEQIFKSRIIRCLEIDKGFAEMFKKEDDEFEANLLKQQNEEELNKKGIEQFIDGVVGVEKDDKE